MAGVRLMIVPSLFVLGCVDVVAQVVRFFFTSLLLSSVFAVTDVDADVDVAPARREGTLGGKRVVSRCVL